MTVEMNDLVHNSFVKSLGTEERRFITNNVAIFLLLEEVSTNFRLCVGTAHLYWDPKFTDGTGVAIGLTFSQSK